MNVECICCITFTLARAPHAATHTHTNPLEVLYALFAIINFLCQDILSFYYNFCSVCLRACLGCVCPKPFRRHSSVGFRVSLRFFLWVSFSLCSFAVYSRLFIIEHGLCWFCLFANHVTSLCRVVFGHSCGCRCHPFWWDSRCSAQESSCWRCSWWGL